MEVTGHIFSIPAEPAFYTGPQAPNVFMIVDGGEGAQRRVERRAQAADLQYGWAHSLPSGRREKSASSSCGFSSTESSSSSATSWRLGKWNDMA